MLWSDYETSRDASEQVSKQASEQVSNRESTEKKASDTHAKPMNLCRNKEGRIVQ